MKPSIETIVKVPCSFCGKEYSHEYNWDPEVDEFKNEALPLGIYRLEVNHNPAQEGIGLKDKHRTPFMCVKCVPSLAEDV